MNNYIDLAYKATAESTHSAHQMAAVVVRGGAILSIAANTSKHHTCCERRAIRPHMNMRGATIIVVRSNRSMSKPCTLCQQIIIDAGIKKVVYFDWDGKLVISKVSKMET